MRFLHMRYHDDEAEAAYQDERAPMLAKGGLTVAYEVKDNQIEYAVSKCHVRDNFCRKLGRDISMGRLLAGHKVVIQLDEKTPIQSLIRNSVYAMYKDMQMFDIAYRLF